MKVWFDFKAPYSPNSSLNCDLHSHLLFSVQIVTLFVFISIIWPLSGSGLQTLPHAPVHLIPWQWPPEPTLPSHPLSLQQPAGHLRHDGRWVSVMVCLTITAGKGNNPCSQFIISFRCPTALRIFFFYISNETSNLKMSLTGLKNSF